MGDHAKTSRSKDGTSAKNNHEKHFEYGAHTIVNEIKIIEKLSVTPANVHYSQIDLSIPGIICYRDKGYFGSDCKGINGTMDHAVRGHLLQVKSIRRNLRFSRIRSMVGHPYAVMKGIFHFFHVMVTTVQRVMVKTYFTAMCYNLVRARFLGRIKQTMDIRKNNSENNDGITSNMVNLRQYYLNQAFNQPKYQRMGVFGISRII
jgi:IS5 family transposase